MCPAAIFSAERDIEIHESVSTGSGRSEQEVASIRRHKGIDFVVVAVDINPGLPDAVAGSDTATNACISTTSRTTMGFIDDSNVLATMQEAIQIGALPSGVPFSQSSLDSPPATLDYIGIIATNDYFLSVEGTNNAVAKSASCRVWGYRAQATADIFAALTQSELLSA